jgi:hypothetical protein
MEPISKIFQKKPPKLLYHYTTQEGLIGIIEKRSIWASKIQYLNDTQEFKLAINLARDSLKKLKYSKNSMKSKIDEMIEDLEEIPDINVFVCSFSEKEDLLSQWRAYSSFGNGYCIGFSTKVLLQHLKQDRLNFFLVPCIYKEACQKKIINQLVKDALANNAKRTNINSAVGCYNPQLAFIDCLVTLAPILKNSSFKEEAEWRLISTPKAIGLKFRPGRSTIIPYIEYIYCLKNITPLCKIITGPSPESKLKKAAVQSLLQYNSFNKCKVIESKIPFRDW